MKTVTLAMLVALNTGLMAVETENVKSTPLDSLLHDLENKVYIGIDIGNAKVESTKDLIGERLDTHKVESGSFSNKKSGNAQTLKIGYPIDSNSRVMAFYQNMSADNAKGSTYGIGYDYLIGDNEIKPFVGVFAGRNTLKISSQDGRTDSDISGMGYGAQAGVNYTYTKNVSFEAGYRYMKLNSEQTVTYSGPEVTYLGYDGTLTRTVKVDKITNLFVGVNYKF